MTHQDLKEAAMKVIEVRSTYIMSQSSDVSRDWGEALAEFRRIGNVDRILSLIADYERMREALEKIAGYKNAQMTGGKAAFFVEWASAALKEKPHD